jgi:tetratricopeptide (TPR) repeat protein
MKQENIAKLRLGILVLSGMTAVFLSYQNYFHYENKPEQEITTDEASADNASTEDMIEQLAATADLDSLNANLQLQVARLFLEAEQPATAVKYYSRYEKLEAPTADLLAEIGTVMWLAKPSAQSVSYFTRALELDSVNGGALFGLARMMLEIGDKDRSIGLFQKIVDNHQGEEIAISAASWIENIEKLEIEPSKESR